MSNFAFSVILCSFFSRSINLTESVYVLITVYKEKPVMHGSCKSYSRNLPSVEPSVSIYKEKPVMAAIKVIVETYLQ